MDYTEVRRFNSRLEAETVGHALDQYGIPFMVKSDDIGIFGPGHTGAVPSGVALWVPDDRVEEVQRLISCVFPGGESGDS